MPFNLDEGTQANAVDKPTRRKQAEKVGKRNSAITSRITQSLISRGFMIDFAPALSDQVENGAFFRAVVNISTTTQTVDRLMEEINTIGKVTTRKINGSI